MTQSESAPAELGHHAGNERKYARPACTERENGGRERQNRGRDGVRGQQPRPTGDRSAGIQFANGVNCILAHCPDLGLNYD